MGTPLYRGEVYMAKPYVVSSGTLGRYLDRLKGMQASYPLEALGNPSRRTEFEYGEHCGVVKGLLLAEQLLVKVLEDEENDD